MGYYLNYTSTGSLLGLKTKVAQLVAAGDAEVLPMAPESFDAIPPGKAAICAVENPAFTAVGFAYDKNEFDFFKSDDSGRRIQWLLMDRQLAETLTEFP